MGASIVLGLISGLTIGFLAVGLVLVYKANRFINLAHAQMGTYSAVLLAKMVLDWGWSWWAAFPFAIGAGIVTGLLVERYVIRPLRARSASTVALLLVTVGVAQLLSALEFIPILGPTTQKLTLQGYPLPFKSHIKIEGVVLGGQYILVLILVPVVVAALAAFLKYTTMGRMIRAAASNPDAARLVGVSIPKVSMVTWGVAGALAAVTAVVQAPSQPSFDATSLGPDLLLRALGAAAVGGFVSIPAALIGGLGLGLVEQLTLYWTNNGGEADLAVFALILAIVIVRGRVISATVKTSGTLIAERPPLRVPELVAGRAFVRNQTVLLAMFGLFLGLVFPLLPYFRPDYRRFDLTLVLIYALLGVSLTMLVGWAGQISLGHFALIGAGAYLTAKLSPHGFSIPLVLFVSGLIGAAIMVVVGLPAIRIRGLTLVVTTLGLGTVSYEWLFKQNWFGSSRSYGLPVIPPGLYGLGRPSSLLSVYYLSLGVLGIALAGASALRRSLPGRMIVAVRDNESAALTFGVTPATVKLAALGISGFIAATAGVLWADAWQNISLSEFNPALSLSILAIPVIGGLGSLSGAVAASVLIYINSIFIGPLLTGVFGVRAQIVLEDIFGGGGLIAIMLAYPTGIAGAAQRQWEKFLQRVADEAGARAQPGAETAEAAEALVVDDLHLSFGGVRALDGASIRVRRGEIVGLIGPNGAGKSTLINAVSGHLRARGRIHLLGDDVSDLAPDMRWMHGLGRSFQDALLFPGLTVKDVVLIALRTDDRYGFTAALLRFPWAVRAHRNAERAAEEIIGRFGLRPWANTLVSDLSTGTRRICDMAAQVAARPRLLLLDEPTAGVAQREAEAFPSLLRRIRAELDCAILLVEHDMPLLMGLCDRIYAMESGRVIAEGTPEDVRRDPAVIASYLGTERVAIARSGPVSKLPVEAIQSKRSNGRTNEDRAGQNGAVKPRRTRARTSTKDAGGSDPR
jgi:ABC-type branched-subunit amino acid transport system ATPase component/ABC-type branched-subunit amino acid transport system permease subunit